MVYKSFFSLSFLAVVILSLCSCGHSVYVASNSFADMRSIPAGFPYGSTFYIQVPTAGENALLTKEVAHKIATILENKGYEVVKSRLHANYVVSFTMGIKSYKEKVLVPHYVPGPVKTKHTKVLNCFGQWVDVVEETTSPGHYVDVEEERIYFKKDFSVKVADLEKEDATEEEEIVWNASVSSTNKRDDLRGEIDYLLVAAFKHFGRNTQKKVYKDIAASEVKTLRQMVYEV